MTLRVSRSSASFICRSCRALHKNPKTIPQIPGSHQHEFSTTPSNPISHSPIPKASKVNPFARARNNARAQDAANLRVPLLKSGFHLDSVPDYKYWQACITDGVVADTSITAKELHETALKYAQLAVQGEYGEPTRDPDLTTKYDIRLVALYYVHLCLLSGHAPASNALQHFVLHIAGTLITVHEYQPAVLNAARQRAWKTGQILTEDILRRKLKEGGEGNGFVDANAATLAGLQCLWEIEAIKGDVGGSNVVEPVHAVHPSKMNNRNKAKGIPLSPTMLASISRKKQEGLQWFRRAIELSAKQKPRTWNWEVTCYKSMADLYDASSPKERPLKFAALQHLAVQLDNMDGCFQYGMALPKGSELRETMLIKAAATGHEGAQKEMERICLDKLMDKDKRGLTKEEVKHLAIMADEWGLMSQGYNSPQ